MADEQSHAKEHEADSSEEGNPLEMLRRVYDQHLGRETTSDDPVESGPPEENVPDDEHDAAEERVGKPARNAQPRDSAVSPRNILEAMLFVGTPTNEPLTREEAASRMRGVTPEELDQLVEQLNGQYDALGCPYHIVTAGAGYRMVLRDEFHSLRDNFYGKVRQARLSQAAVDVLSVVAYRQPVTREDVDELRGKDSGGLLRQLVRRELLRVEMPKAKGDGRYYFTTERFLALFGLRDLDDLPQSEEDVETTS